MRPTAVTCPSCHEETSPVQVGTGTYCTKCGQRVELARQANKRPRGMDISAVRHPKPVQTVSQKLTKPTPPHALDLRAMKPAPVKTSTMVVKPSVPRASQAPHTDKPSSDSQRLARAQAVQKSAHISRFHQGNPSQETPHVAPAPHTANFAARPTASVASLPATVQPEPTPAVITHHESLSTLIQTTKREQRKERRAANKRGRVAATLAAVLIMGAYVWLQNYPKLAVRSAANRSGVNASLPGYMPSSYSLAGTQTTAGVVTLSFKSPSQPEPMTIQQQRTAWDSASLLDSYVANNSAAYSAIENHGLTVYLLDNNVATWVNRGIWYTIAGTGRLSRDQVLKIAYSLQ